MNNALIILILCSFFAGMLLIGYVTSKKTKTMSDFYIGGRTFGTFTTSATQIASAFGGGMMVAHVGIGYAYGFAEFVYVGMAFPLGVWLLSRFLTNSLRDGEYFTTADWMCGLYGESKSLRLATSVTTLMVTLSWWISQPVAAGKIIHALTGIPLEVGIIVSVIVVVIYTMSGGMLAVAYTDVLQLCLMVLGVAVLLPITLIKAGGISTVMSLVPAQNLGFMAPGKSVIIGWIFAVTAGQMVLPIYHQRILAARTSKIAKKSLKNLMISCIIAGVWASLLGMAIYALNPMISDSETAVVWAIENLLPSSIAVFILAAIVAAIVSTADSALHTSITSISRDIYHQLIHPTAKDEDIMGFSKKATVFLGVIGISIGIFVPQVIKLLVLGYTLTASGLLFPLVLGCHWDKVNSRGALGGIIGGIVAAITFSVAIPIFSWSFPAIIPGLLVSLFCTIIFSNSKNKSTELKDYTNKANAQ